MTPAAPAGSSSLTVDDVLAKVRASGGRVTAGRRAIVELLTEGQDRHLSADELIAAVRERLPEVAESTIYRTLTALEELRIVSHVHLGHGPATFHLRGPDHRHLVCNRCGAVVPIPARLINKLASEVRQAYGFSIEEEHFALTGECAGCAASHRRA